MITDPKEGGASSQNQPSEPQKSWTSEYYNAAKAGFSRIWANRFLWFWGFFLPVGMGASFNYNFSPEESKFSEGNGVDFASAMEKFGSFVHENLTWFVIGFALFVVVSVLFWILSAIARLGVTRAIEQMQDPTSPITYNFKEIWNQGKVGFGQILLLDFVIGLMMLLIGIVLSLPMFVMFLRQQFGYLIFLAILAALIYIPIAILGYFLKTSGVIVHVLSNVKIKRAIEIAYGYVSGNLKEVLKLVLTFFVLGLLHGVAVMAAIFSVIIVGAVLTFFFGVVIGFDAIAGSSLVGVAVIVGVLLLIIFISALVLIKAIFSVWTWDIWIWWTKKVGAIHKEQEQEDAIRIGKQAEQETSPTIE
jgi:hypothetical protein